MSGDKPFVMMLDDDRLTLEMYGAGLEYAGFRVAAVTHPEELLAALRVQLPDVVVLDWQLGEMTGGDVLEELRRDHRTIALPVFVLSNFTSPNGAVDRVFAAGAIAWLTKSSTPPAKLAERLREVVNR